ncbi:uncharacterized protein LOC144139012 [Haemaphysalis longicornis]
MAQFTSDLSGGEEMPRKRRRVRPARWVDDDSTSVESDSDGFPPAPTAFITSEPPPRLEGSSQGLAHQSSPVPLLQSPSTSTNSGGLHEGLRQLGHAATSASSSMLQQGRDQQGQEGLQISQGPGTCAENCGPGNSSKALSCAEFQRRVLTSLSIIRHTQMEILESLHGLATKNNGNVDPPTEPVMAGPLGSVEAVLAFDETLAGGYREALVAELASFGGKAIPASVKAMMPHLLTDGVAQQFSMEGRKGKERFRGLKLCQVIVDAVRKSKFLGDSPRSEVEIHVREWLRRAKERAAFGVKKT